ncbi:RALF-like 1 protein [Nymphaea thermarum]|nr:RALF-like 1 protein [Nymphaea thermarum]
MAATKTHGVLLLSALLLLLFAWPGKGGEGGGNVTLTHQYRAGEMGSTERGRGAFGCDGLTSECLEAEVLMDSEINRRLLAAMPINKQYISYKGLGRDAIQGANQRLVSVTCTKTNPYPCRPCSVMAGCQRGPTVGPGSDKVKAVGADP